MRRYIYFYFKIWPEYNSLSSEFLVLEAFDAARAKSFVRMGSQYRCHKGIVYIYLNEKKIAYATCAIRCYPLEHLNDKLRDMCKEKIWPLNQLSQKFFLFELAEQDLCSKRYMPSLLYVEN